MIELNTLMGSVLPYRSQSKEHAFYVQEVWPECSANDCSALACKQSLHIDTTLNLDSVLTGEMQDRE